MKPYKYKIGRLNIKTSIAIICFVTALAGCAKPVNKFEMTVDRVDELQGMILKGISISGTIEKGCIANDDEYLVKRAGKEVLKNDVRILSIRDPEDPDAFDGKAFETDYVTLYIPDGKKTDVKPGDILISNAISCEPASKK